PILRSLNTRSSSLASVLGARRRPSLGSPYSYEETMSALRVPTSSLAVLGGRVPVDPRRDETIPFRGGCAGELQGVVIDGDPDAPIRSATEPGGDGADHGREQRL